MARINGVQTPMTMAEATAVARELIARVGKDRIEAHTITERHWDSGPSIAEQVAGASTIGRGAASSPIQVSREVRIAADPSALGMAIWDGAIDGASDDAAEIAEAIYAYR